MTVQGTLPVPPMPTGERLLISTTAWDRSARLRIRKGMTSISTLM